MWVNIWHFRYCFSIYWYRIDDKWNIGNFSTFITLLPTFYLPCHEVGMASNVLKFVTMYGVRVHGALFGHSNLFLIDWLSVCLHGACLQPRHAAAAAWQACHAAQYLVNINLKTNNIWVKLSISLGNMTSCYISTSLKRKLRNNIDVTDYFVGDNEMKHVSRPNSNALKDIDHISISPIF